MAVPPLDRPLSRRNLLKSGAGLAGAAVVGPTLLAACGSSGGESVASTTTADGAGASIGQAVGGPELLEAAKADGALRTIAVGEPGSYYMPVIEGFEKYAGFEVETLHPTYPPKGAVEDVMAAKDDPPYDVLEVAVDWASTAATEKIVTPYRSTLWDDIPSAMKDPAGYWSAAYFGTVAFIVNTDKVETAPKSWAELLDSGAQDSFGMLGSPAEGGVGSLAGGLSLLTVMSASLANGGDLDNVEPGIDLIAQLVAKGIFQPSGPGEATSPSMLAIPYAVGSGTVPVSALFSFDLPAAEVVAKDFEFSTASFTPTDGRIASFYPQAVVANATNQDAAKLWIEYLQSDFGAEEFLAGGAIPARHAALRNNSSTSKAILDKLPSEEETSAPIPTLAQMAAAQEVVNEQWSSKIYGS